MKRIFLKQVSFNCEKTNYYRYLIYNRQNIIDSIDCKQMVFGNGDIPETTNNRNRLIIYNQDYFKIYSNDRMEYQWQKKYWLEKIEILKEENDKNYFLLGDTLYIVIKTQTRIPLDTRTTLNGFIIDSSSTDYQTILAFDILNNKFIGYPTTIIDKQNLPTK